VEHDRSLTPELLQEARDQFFREASILARLDHPNLPKVSDYFSIGARDYLVMDYVPGNDLRTLIIETRQKGQFLTEDVVLGWAAQLADALDHLHSQSPPLVHRDIKPSNLKVTPSGVLKLVDFGLVKVLAPGEVTITILQGQGTALYTPIEQYGGDSSHTDVRSDIFAFGATLYHLLTNQPPSEARARFLAPDDFISPRQVNPNISLRCERAILWAMSLHPNDRPESISQLRKSLFGDMLPPQRTPRIEVSSFPSSLLNTRPDGILFWLAMAVSGLTLLLTLFQ
jgi:serine/threonine-protein kinase